MAFMLAPCQNAESKQPNGPEYVTNKVGYVSAGDTQRDKQAEYNKDHRGDPGP